MSNDEQKFLNNIRKALGKTESDARPDIFDTTGDGLEAVLERSKRNKKEQLQLLSALKESAVPLSLNVHEVATIHDAASGIAEIAKNTDTEWGGEKRVITHDTPLMAELDLASVLAAESIAVDVARFEPGEDELAGKQRLRELTEAAYIGVTGADWCAVDCAALAMLTGPGKGRATSLVPSIHIAVIALDNLVADLSEIYAHMRNLETMPASLTFISGPSKTADIEAQLVHGAHGPREMHLFVVTD